MEETGKTELARPVAQGKGCLEELLLEIGGQMDMMGQESLRS